MSSSEGENFNIDVSDSDYESDDFVPKKKAVSAHLHLKDIRSISPRSPYRRQLPSLPKSQRKQQERLQQSQKPRRKRF